MTSAKLIKRPEKILLIASFQSYTVPSIIETIESVLKGSEFNFTFINLMDLKEGAELSVINLSTFSGLIIHNTVAFDVKNLQDLDGMLRPSLSKYDGVKIILKQDEHYRFHEFTKFAKKAKFDFLFSVMPDSEIPKTYGAYLPGVRICKMLTGYVTKSLREPRQFLVNRTIDIGYRGSIMPLSYGRLCYQKRKIGDEVQKRLSNRNLVLNISSRWEDRLGAGDWVNFLASCKGVLGVESGTDVFDLDGTLEKTCLEIELELGNDDGTEEYSEKYLKKLDKFIGQVNYVAVSPRHLEAAAAGTIQILFPGHYSGLLEAGRHYFELATNYSNLDEAVDILKNNQHRIAMAEIAYEEIILQKDNWIESFVANVDDAIKIGLEEKGLQAKQIILSKCAGKNVLVVQAARYGLDPRRDSWYASGAPEGVLIHQLGITDKDRNEIIFKGPHGETVINVPRLKWDAKKIEQYALICANNVSATLVLQELIFIHETLQLDKGEFCEVYKIPLQSRRIDDFKTLLQYFLDTALTHIDAGVRTNGTQLIVAVNLPSLLSAIVLKAILGVSVIYEALEYWPEIDPAQDAFEENFLKEFERRLVCLVEHRGTVSPQLAKIMSCKFGVDFYFVPNCIPLNLKHNEIKRTVINEKSVRFLFQGVFSPFRGIELLIKIWSKTSSNSILLLRGPDSVHKSQMIKMADSTGLLGKRIFFPSAVETNDLAISAKRDGDVGLIPYEPIGINYSNCSPNKLSQYLSVGLPILANRTNFVDEVISSSQCGLAVDFNDEKSLLDAIEKMVDSTFRLRCSQNSLSHFKEKFNWEKLSKPFYSAIELEIAKYKAKDFSYFKADNLRFDSLASSVIVNQIYSRNNYFLLILKFIWKNTPTSLRIRFRPIVLKVLRLFLGH